ncbi:hypothetical protein DC915_RS03260 [Vibrio parahaemolyticus]|uniref:Uncharacterized protein n=1 Tax=Vibrio jasicida TaxID=766224 RepID=A0AAU9QP64_9VIBR|nr:hypothetical protein [Vibrio parahaemolyticus]EJG0009998.1 hypothetical protein [Vibrio parahaemolyticus]CAH1592741.1 conserved hypothetical protein [Vibrio jasicida]CAH1597427.1 conserved hypothetical protein [Vibrio jasicida]
MRISLEDLDKPELRRLRDNLRLFHGTKPTTVGTMISIIASIGELCFTIGIVLVLLVDSKYTFTQMLIGLFMSFLMHLLANAYDKRFAKIIP